MAKDRAPEANVLRARRLSKLPHIGAALNVCNLCLNRVIVAREIFSVLWLCRCVKAGTSANCRICLGPIAKGGDAP